MRNRPFGPLEREVPVIGLGTWHLERADHDDAIAAIRRAVELEMTHIDTAEMYGSGKVEEIVGEALVGLRHQVFLASKVLPQNASYPGTLRACQDSLRRLRTDHLDLYLLHWRGPYPLAETFRAFEKLRSDGLIRAWGVSNFDDADLEEALGVSGPGRIACDQVLYHQQERTVEHTVLPWCERNRCAMVGYSPFGSGEFPEPSSPGGKVLAAVAAAHGATPRQVALAFLVRKPPVFTIPKAATPAHVEENAGAGGLELSTAEIARIDAAFPRGPWRELQTI